MRLACVQMDVVYGDTKKNLTNVLNHLERLAGQGVDLAVFPECALTGYAAGDGQEADRIALGKAGHESGKGWKSELQPIQEACSRLGIAAIVGYLGHNGMDPFNGTTLFLPTEGWFHYVKTHLPFMGADRFCTQGSELEPFDTPWGKIGILICFDLRFPEPARTLALKGADLIVVPTNWPQGAEVSADHIAIARAAENRVFVATCNRVGDERGFHFIGRSKIVGIDGTVLATAEGGVETLVADLDLALARQKRRVVIPGEYETDAFARRTDLYAR